MRLIKIPTMDGRFHKKNYVLNPVGKSPVNILNEYVQRAFSGRVTYEYEDARYLFLMSDLKKWILVLN